MTDMSNKFKWLAPVVLGVAMVGCASNDTDGSGADGTSGVRTSGGQTASSGATATSASRAAGDAQALNQRVVYFDFDSSVVSSRYMRVLEAHAQNLRANPKARVRLEGHADERGTREYNIGLGERRARAVEKILLLKGASRNQISTLSYGEERPVALGHNEDAWRLNRRVELVYK